MKSIYVLLLSLICQTFIIAKQVSPEQAKKVGISFLQTYSIELIHAEEARIMPDTTIYKLYYIFNDEYNNSFVIVAGDDASYPILGYSKESIFRKDSIGSNVSKWLDGYERELRYIIRSKLPPTDDISREWISLLEGQTQSMIKGETVSPLLTTKWNQSPYYNAMCPYDNNQSARSVTGCVATAMAQIMKYWNHPAKGVGSHSYVHSKYGTLSANFSITNYNWSNMPNQVTSTNNDVATLMYHCGVSVNMDYSPSVSGAYVISEASQTENCSEFAFKEYFDYSSSTIGVRRSSYTESVWIQMLKEELDNQRPIMYAGFGSGGGHAFVCDGYDTGNYFHFNWGWGGVYDGYFTINALNPGTGGTGGGSGNFNQHQQAIFNLEPNVSNNVPEMDLALYTPLTVNPSTINYLGTYTLAFNLVNNGNEIFKGDYVGVLVDENYDIVDVTASVTESNGLPPSYVYNNNIQLAGTLSDTVLPGTYHAIILARPLGGDWQIVNDGNHSNYVSAIVNSVSNIVMNKQFTISPTNIVEGKPVSITYDVLNKGSDFLGTISLDLHDESGYWIKSIGRFTNVDLKYNYHFTNGITFTSSDGFGVPPGTYQIVAWTFNQSLGWQIVKSENQMINPLSVIISKPELVADQFENNNSKVTATRIPYGSQQQYSYSTAYTSIHNTDDVDYYKIDLPAGSTYFINARIQDEYNRDNGKTYTVDAMWNYSIGNLSSDSYDDINTDGSIIIEGGKTIYFNVYPFFQGKTGTYDFEVVISKSVPKDIYEDNNTIVTSFNMSQTFPNLKKTLSATGASIHSDSDIDYYKIICPSDYYYSIVPYIRDKNYLNSANYTIDCEWSYTTNGSTWSQWYDGPLSDIQSVTLNSNYTLFVRVKPKNQGDVGTYAFDFEVTKTLNKDNYEDNNQVSSSSLLFASFLANNSIVTTQSASLHNPSDVDYYTIELPAGYTYTIDNFLSDIVSSNDGKVYSIDAKFAISSNGIQWTDFYENSYNALKIIGDKPSKIYVRVMASKPNTIGTYKFSANIQRSLLTNIKEELQLPYLLIKNKDNYTIQPLPQTGIKTLSIFSSDGKRLSAVSDIYESFKIEYLPSGIYHMYQTQDGSYYYEKLIFQN